MTQSTAAQAPDEIYVQLVPLEGDNLLLPKVAVVEVLGMEEVMLSTNPPEWLLGHLEWRGRRIAVVSVEAMVGREPPAKGRRSRLVVINSLGEQMDGDAFAVVCQGYPHLSALNRAALNKTEDDAKDDPELVLSRVAVANNRAFIPDLAAIEERIQQANAMQSAGDDWQAGGISLD